MKATVEPLEGNKVKLSVEIDEEEFDKAVDVALRKIAREVRIPGFRPGKAPRRLLEARMGKEGVRQEAMKDALPDYYAEALRQTEVDAIAPPEIDITSGQESGLLAFDAVVEVRPMVNVPGYQGLQVTVPAIQVTDEELDRQIDRLRHPYGELKEVTRPAADGDHVTINISGAKDGEGVGALTADDFLYEVGSGGIVAEVDENLRAASPGETKEFEATIGEDTVTFTVEVKDVKEMVLPDITDDWASEASEFETVDELRADIEARMEQIKKVQASLSLREGVLTALADLVAEDPPEALVKSEVDRRLHDLAHRLEPQGATIDQYLAATGQDPQELVDEMRTGATNAVKADLGLRAVAESENLEVTEEDLEEEFAKLAERVGQSVAELREQLERADQMPAVRSDIRKAKALGWLMDNVEIIDEAGNKVERSDLEPTPPTAPTEAEEEETKA